MVRWQALFAPGEQLHQQRSVAAIASSAGAKTNVAVSFIDNSLVPSEAAFLPEIVPSWVPVYPGKIENLRYKGHSGGFSVTTTDSAVQVSGFYAAILRASGYEVDTGYDYHGGYYTRGTAKSQERSIAATASTENNITKVIVLFDQQQKQ